MKLLGDRRSFERVGGEKKKRKKKEERSFISALLRPLWMRGGGSRVRGRLFSPLCSEEGRKRLRSRATVGEGKMENHVREERVLGARTTLT